MNAMGGSGSRSRAEAECSETGMQIGFHQLHRFKISVSFDDDQLTKNCTKMEADESRMATEDRLNGQKRICTDLVRLIIDHFLHLHLHLHLHLYLVHGAV